MKALLTLIAGLIIFTTTSYAKTKPELIIYTYDSFATEWGPGPQIEQTFEAQCGCDLKFITAGDGAALLSRIQLEGKYTQADILLGLDTNLISKAEKTGLFAMHGINNPALNLPLTWENKTFLPYDWGYFAFVYDNTDLKNPPESFEAIINTPDDFKIIIQDPRSSTPGLGLLLWVKHIYGNRAAEIWAGLAPKILTITKGWSEAYNMFLEGEADMVLSYTTSPAYHSIAEGDNSKSAAHFKKGHYMQIETAAKLLNTDEPKLANDFLTFMLSPEFQNIIPTTNWMYPAALPTSSLPAGFDQLIKPEKSLLYTEETAEKIRTQALDEWLTTLSQ